MNQPFTSQCIARQSVRSVFVLRKVLRFTTSSVFLWLCAALTVLTQSHAASFIAEVDVQCPANVLPPENIAIDLEFSHGVQWVACSGIRVAALASRAGVDTYCGAGYTGSSGHARFVADCGAEGGATPTVYLLIYARSLLGFEVVTGSPGHLQQLDAANSFNGGLLEKMGRILTGAIPFAWQTDERRISGTSMHWGNFRTAHVAHTDDRMTMLAAKLYWASSYTMHRLRASTRYRPMEFALKVDGIFPVGTPWTMWNTVMYDFAAATNDNNFAVWSTPHEIGHVLYNTYHSNLDHWATDFTDYLTHHSFCEGGHYMTLGWYEGFANWVRQLAFSRTEWTSNNLTLAEPRTNCRNPHLPGFDREGNVTAALDLLYYGTLGDTPREPMTSAMFSCPAGFTRLVKASGAVACRRIVNAQCAVGRTLRIDGAGGINDACERPGVEQVAPAMYQRITATCRLHTPPDCPRDVEAYVSPSCPADMITQRVVGVDTCMRLQGATSAFPGQGPLPRGDGSPDHILAANAAGQRQWYELASADTIIQGVENAGATAHRMEEFWRTQFKPWCERLDGVGLPRYCATAGATQFRTLASTLSAQFP